MTPSTGKRISSCAGKGRPYGPFLATLFLVLALAPAQAQHNRPDREWAERLPVCTLAVVYPTFAVRHERMAKALEAPATRDADRRRAERIMANDLALRDTLLVALSTSLRAHYGIGPAVLVADTTARRWQREGGILPGLDSLLRPVSLQTDPGRILLLRYTDTDRTTGTGISVWEATLADGSTLPERFPTAFREGSAGLRLLEFAESFLIVSPRRASTRDLLPQTRHLFRQLQRKWGKYLDKWG